MINLFQKISEILKKEILENPENFQLIIDSNKSNTRIFKYKLKNNIYKDFYIQEILNEDGFYSYILTIKNLNTNIFDLRIQYDFIRIIEIENNLKTQLL